MTLTREQKTALRATVLEKRASMDEEQWKRKSGAIIKRLKNESVFKNAESVHTYISMNERREVCTDHLLKYLFQVNKEVLVPITNFEDHSLIHASVSDTTQFEANKWGVREPIEYQPGELSSVDPVRVPIAAADMEGNRLGYGKGFYDRFLSRISAKKVGLVFDDFLFQEIPAEPFDEKMDLIITEERVIFA